MWLLGLSRNTFGILNTHGLVFLYSFCYGFHAVIYILVFCMAVWYVTETGVVEQKVYLHIHTHGDILYENSSRLYVLHPCSIQIMQAVP